MIGIWLALLVAFFKSLSEWVWKNITSSQNINLDEYSLAFAIRALSFFLLLIPGLIFVNYIDFSAWALSLLLWSALLNSITTVSALKAVKYGDLSIVWPMSAFTLPFLIVTSFIITGEIPNTSWYIWVGLIFFWTYFLQIHEAKSGLFWPIKALFSNTWARYMMLSAFLWSIASPLDKLGIEIYGVFSWFFLQVCV